MDLHSDKKAIELLKEIEMLQDFSDSELEELGSILQVFNCDAGKELFREGDPGGKMYILAEGTVEIQKRRSHGTGRVVISRFDRGGIIGEMSLIDRMPRSATVIAVQPSKLYVLSQEAFDTMISENQALAIKLLKGLAILLSMRLRNTSGWFADVF